MTDEEKLQKVELVSEKCDVSYADARAALELCDYDVLDAVVLLERQGKTARKTAQATTADQPTAEARTAEQMAIAQKSYAYDTRKSRFEENLDKLFSWLKRVLKKLLDTTLVVSRHGERLFSIPLLVVILLALAFWVTVPLLIVSLFFDVRYRFEGVGRITVDFNDLSEKVSEGVDTLKREARDIHDSEASRKGKQD